MGSSCKIVECPTEIQAKLFGPLFSSLPHVEVYMERRNASGKWRFTRALQDRMRYLTLCKALYPHVDRAFRTNTTFYVVNGSQLDQLADYLGPERCGDVRSVLIGDPWDSLETKASRFDAINRFPHLQKLQIFIAPPYATNMGSEGERGALRKEVSLNRTIDEFCRHFNSPKFAIEIFTNAMFGVPCVNYRRWVGRRIQDC